MTVQQWIGRDLGSRAVSYDERDVILYALAVGARATDLDLVFERQLRVLPTFALTLAQWAPDVLAEQGAWDVGTALHGSQRLQVLAPLPAQGEIVMSATVTDVWDKTAAAIFDITVQCAYFRATWSIFAPGRGDFGGSRGPATPKQIEPPPDIETEIATFAAQAALYRLTGDRHLIHIDPEASAAIGQPRPILHGLCTMAAATLQIAAVTGAHPADLVELSGRFAAPVVPGSRLGLSVWHGEQALDFRVRHDGRDVLTAGRARFAPQQRSAQ